MTLRLDWLERAVSAALKGRPIGQPVAVRAVLAGIADHGLLAPALAQLVEMAGRWFASAASRLYAQGGAAAGHLTALAEFARGETALLTVESGEPLVALLLIGNHGTLRFDDRPDSLAASAAGSPLRAAIEASLRSGRAIALPDTAIPQPAPPALPSAEAPSGDAPRAAPRVIAAKPPYGVLLLSGGFTHQENYGPGFAADPRCRVVGVTDEPGVDPRRARLNRALADEMKVPLLPDLDRALARSDVHIASICSEHERQGRLAVRCAQAGKHLYLDKPIAASPAEARRIAEAASRAGVRSHMFTQLNQPYAQRARREVDSGRLGELRAIHCDLLFAKGHPGSAPLGRPRREQYPPERFLLPDAKRELFNIAVYSLALIAVLARRPVVSVRAVTSNYFFEEHYRRGFEDFGMMALTLEGGLTATVSAGRIGWSSHPAGGPIRVRLLGTRAAALIDAWEPRAEIASDRLAWQPPPRDPDDPMGFWASTQRKAGARPRPDWFVPAILPVRSDQSLFLDCLEQNRRPEIDAAAGARIVEVLFAAYRSAAAGDVVPVPPGA